MHPPANAIFFFFKDEGDVGKVASLPNAVMRPSYKISLLPVSEASTQTLTVLGFGIARGESGFLLVE